MNGNQLLARAREGAEWYEANLVGRETTIYCKDGFCFAISWHRECYPHLTGLYLRRAKNDSRPVSPGVFYELLLQKRHLDAKRLGFTDNHHFADLKAEVLLEAINPKNTHLVYEITSGVFLLGMGDMGYCLGLVRDVGLSYGERNVYRPKSVFNGDILNAKGFSIQTVYDVADVVTRFASTLSVSPHS